MIQEEIWVFRGKFQRSFGQPESLIKPLLANEELEQRLPGSGIGGICRDRPPPRSLGLFWIPFFGLLPCESSLQLTVKRIQRSGLEQFLQIIRLQSQIVARLIQRAPYQQEHCRGHPHSDCKAAGARSPSARLRESSARVGHGTRNALPGIQQKRRNASVAQLPDRTIQDEVMDIHERGKDQETRTEVM